MRLISHLNGNVALRVSSDEVTPINGVMARHVIDFINKLYQFSVTPDIPEGIPPIAVPYYVYQSGVLERDNETLPIQQLVTFQNGYMVTARNTGVGDAILDHLTKELDEGLGYRFSSAKQSRTYQSSIVVQFEPALEERIATFDRIEKVLNERIRRPRHPFKTKRVAFGYGDVAAVTAPVTIATLEESDFVIERRASEPYSENRYYCSAPVSSPDHLKILEAVESVFDE